MPKWQRRRLVPGCILGIVNADGHLLAAALCTSTLGYMPVELQFEEPATFKVRASGEVTFAEVEVLLGEILTHPNLGHGVRMLVDGREVEKAPSTPELRKIAADFGPLVERGLGPVAIVTDSQVIYGVARMFSVFAEMVNANVAPFRCIDEARRWLSSPTDTT